MNHNITPPDMSTIKKILIVKLSSIGDVVHALPVSAALGDAFPNIEISWVVEQMSAPIVKDNPYLKEVIVLPSEWRSRGSISALHRFSAIRSEIRRREFDMAIDLQGLSKSALVAWGSGAKYRYGYDWMRELAPRLITRVPRRTESLHVVDQFLDVARFLGAPVETVKFPLVISEEKKASASKLFCEFGLKMNEDFIVINPSSGGGGNKGWSVANYILAIDRLAKDPGFPIVLVGSKGDAPICHAIQEGVNVPITNLSGRTDLGELIAILGGARLHLCGDTGSAHIAAALNTRVVSIFGRSNPDRLAPYGQGQFALHHRELCSDICRKFHDTAPINSKQKCLAPPPACLSAVHVDEVVSTCKMALDSLVVL